MTEHPITDVPTADLRRARRALLLVGAAAPVVLTAVALTLIALWLPEIPDPAAVHWGVHGVDGVGAASAYVWSCLGIGLLLPLLMVGSTLLATRHQWGGAARLLGALAIGLSGFGAAMSTGSVAIQRGLTDALDAPGIGGVLTLAFAAMLGLGTLGWFLQPHVRPTPATPLEPVHLAAISAGERVVWIGSATMSRTGAILIAIVMALVAGITVWMAVLAPETVWIPALTLLVVAVAIGTTASFQVKAGPDGLSVRSRFGMPRTTVPLDEIVAVRAVDCNPFGEFGGVGWRIGLDGRTGIVLRRGPAIEVERRDRRPLVVTVDGAAVGAAVLQAYLDAPPPLPTRPGSDGGPR